MKLKMAKTSLCVMIITLGIGFIMIFSSLSLGQNIGDNAMQKNGGAMDTRAYERIIDTSTSNFQTVGEILSLIGGLGILLSGYAFYKEL